MSNFDELFNSVENTEMVKDLLSDDTFSKLRSGVVEALARDSKIKLVTPYDKDRPLDTGAYWYDSEENTLYVGAGDFQTLINIVDFLNHYTSIGVIRAPRIKFSFCIDAPIVEHNTAIVYSPAPRIKFNHVIEILSISHDTISCNTITNETLLSNAIVIPILSHETEVIK